MVRLHLCIMCMVAGGSMVQMLRVHLIAGAVP